MVTFHDAPADALIPALADRLEEHLTPPEWSAFTKAGRDREFPPEDPGFWYTRAASILRRIAINGPVGVERLSTFYGGAKHGSNRYEVGPAHHADASQKIIRTIIQQLEEAGLVEESPGSNGRILTGDGHRLLDTTAGEVLESLDNPELERYL